MIYVNSESLHYEFRELISQNVDNKNKHIISTFKISKERAQNARTLA